MNRSEFDGSLRFIVIALITRDVPEAMFQVDFIQIQELCTKCSKFKFMAHTRTDKMHTMFRIVNMPSEVREVCVQIIRIIPCGD